MSAINVVNLSFGYENSYDNIFENVSVVLDTDWKLGFCGRNGRGKTTFLKLLLGELEYSGSISASVDFDYFPRKVKNPDYSGQEVLEEIAPNIKLWQIKKEFSLLNLDEGVLYRPFNTLSNGDQTKVLLAGLFLNDNKFLLIDEPTNHLDSDSRQIVAKYLKSKKGFVLVSHDRYFLDECVDHILSINKNNIEVISGNFSTWYNQKQKQDSFEKSENEKLEKEIDRLEGSVKQATQWANKSESRKIGIDPNKVDNKMGYRVAQGAKSKKKMAQAGAIQKRLQADIESKSGLLKNVESTFSLKLQPLKHHSNRLVELRNVGIKYDGYKVLEDFNLSVNYGDRIALSGSNGSGKSSILKLIVGLDIPHTGQVKLANGLIISYVPQDASFLAGNLSDFASNNGIDETLFKAILHKLDFSKAQFDKDISNFSMGQKKKVLIAKSLSTLAHLYIWDEPLNYIDIISRMQIEDLILSSKPTMVFVEHDKAFMEKIASNVVEL